MGVIAKTKNLEFHRAWENYRDLLIVLLQREMQLRYKNKALGYVWSIASPLASAFVYFIAFKIVMRVAVEDYPLVLITGIFPWQWFTNAIGSAPRIFAGNAALIKKVSFPRSIIPLTMVLNHMAHFLFSVPVIFVMMLFYQEQVSWSWVYGIPILTTIQLVMTYGISVFLASLNLFLRDLERLTSIILSFTFYLTPIIYTEKMIPPEYRHLIYFNPLASLMIDWRNLFLHGTMNPMHLLVSSAYAILFFAIGHWVYKTLSWRFGEVL